MAIPQVSGAIELVIDARLTSNAGLDSKRIVNVMHFAAAAAPSPYSPNLVTFLASCQTLLAGVWKALFPTPEYVVTAVTARYMNDTSTPAAVDPAPANYSGVAAGDWIPPDTAVFALIRTAGRGKRYRGGIHLSPVIVTNQVDFELTVAGVANYQSLLTTLATGFTDGTHVMKPFVYSPSSTTLPIIPGPATIYGSYQLGAYALRNTLGSMRRRTPRGRY